MVIKKDLVIAVLSTFCLTATLFTVLPIRSTSSIGTYDPWLDYNDDGKINMRDIGATCNAFGTTGDPTKNVNVTNFPLDEQGNLKVKIVHDYYCDIVFENLMPGEYWHLGKSAASGDFFAFKEISIRLATNGTVRVRLFLNTFVDVFNVPAYEEIYKRHEWASMGFDLYVENEDSPPTWFQLVLYVST